MNINVVSQVAKVAKEKDVVDCKRQIEEYFEEYVQKIRQHHASLLDKLDRVQATDRKNLDAEKSALELSRWWSF